MATGATALPWRWWRCWRCVQRCTGPRCTPAPRLRSCNIVQRARTAFEDIDTFFLRTTARARTSGPDVRCIATLNLDVALLSHRLPHDGRRAPRPSSGRVGPHDLSAGCRCARPALEDFAAWWVDQFSLALRNGRSASLARDGMPWHVLELLIMTCQTKLRRIRAR
jgi:hypothetical protein